MGMEGCTEGHGVAQRGARKGAEGHTEGCAERHRGVCGGVQRGV